MANVGGAVRDRVVRRAVGQSGSGSGAVRDRSAAAVVAPDRTRQRGSDRTRQRCADRRGNWFRTQRRRHRVRPRGPRWHDASFELAAGGLRSLLRVRRPRHGPWPRHGTPSEARRRARPVRAGAIARASATRRPRRRTSSPSTPPSGSSATSASWRNRVPDRGRRPTTTARAAASSGSSTSSGSQRRSAPRDRRRRRRAHSPARQRRQHVEQRLVEQRLGATQLRQQRRSRRQRSSGSGSSDAQLRRRRQPQLRARRQLRFVDALRQQRQRQHVFERKLQRVAAAAAVEARAAAKSNATDARSLSEPKASLQHAARARSSVHARSCWSAAQVLSGLDFARALPSS